MKFRGFLRPDGEVGIRNYVLIFPTVICAVNVAEAISRAVPGTVSVNHPHGCGHLGPERSHIIRSLAGYCRNPNVAGVLLVGLGCELITPEIIAAELVHSRTPFETLSIQKTGGTVAAIKKGVELAGQLKKQARLIKRTPQDIAALRIGVKCGGSDTFSGLTANPALGIACDRLIEAGASVIMTEVPEMIGAEAVLLKRAASPMVAARLRDITQKMEKSILQCGVDVRGTEPSPGNIAGGLTTLEEKSLGAILKGGTSRIMQVVEYAEKPTVQGLIVMDGPALDAVSLTGMLAAGAQIIVFTTGRGSPMGAAIAPVIKVASHSALMASMPDDMDLDAGPILQGDLDIAAVGCQIVDRILAVCNGSRTRSEVLQHHEFAIHNIGPAV
jgi:altronate dehydratase large subunit